tara:strand:- start:1036 stop:1182 length:147 start_codon:yes stop_codon:yes gene_type:complete
MGLRVNPGYHDYMEAGLVLAIRTVGFPFYLLGLVVYGVDNLRDWWAAR